MAYRWARSDSQRRTYRECPHKWYLRYALGWKQKTAKAQWSFGSVMERVAVAIIQQAIRPGEAVELFDWLWGAYEAGKNEYGEPLTYRQHLTHKVLYDRGRILAMLAARQLPSMFVGPQDSVFQLELRYEIAPGHLELGYPDFYGPVKPSPHQAPVLAVVDFKTNDREEKPTLVERNEQLMGYQYGLQARGCQVDAVALCRLVWGAKPSIQWLWHPAFSADVLAEWVHNAQRDDIAIQSEEFPRRYQACHAWGGCWGQPLCFPSKAEEVPLFLVRDEARKGELLVFEESAGIEL